MRIFKQHRYWLSLLCAGSLYSTPIFAADLSLLTTQPTEQQVIIGEFAVELNAQISASQVDDRWLLTIDDEDYVFVVRKIQRHSNGNLTFIGRVAGESASSVLTLSSAGMFGTLRKAEHKLVFKVKHGQQQLMVPSNMDITPIRIDEGGIPVPVSENPEGVDADAPPVKALTVNGTPIIDLMVLWDQALETRLGGAGAVQALIQQRIAETNQAFIDSQIDAEVRLVHSEKRDYSSTASNAVALDTIQSNTGSFAGVESLRERHGADLVGYLRDFNVYSQSAGIAYRLGENGQMDSVDEDYAYFVVTDGEYQSGRTTYYSPDNTFSHELGHNLGSEHDHSHSNNESPIFSYAYGHDVPGVFATIMSYDDPPIMRYSNPQIFCSATEPCGVASGLNAADNARAFNQTAFMVSAFKEIVYEYEESDFQQSTENGNLILKYLPNSSLIYQVTIPEDELVSLLADENTGESTLNLEGGIRLQIFSSGKMTSSLLNVFPQRGFVLPVNYSIENQKVSFFVELSTQRLEF